MTLVCLKVNENDNFSYSEIQFYLNMALILKVI